MVTNPARRVVTGIDAEGRSCVVSDGPPELALRFPGDPRPQTSWSEVNWIWATDGTPTVPPEGPAGAPEVKQWFPGPGGTRFIVETLSPRFGVDRLPDEDYQVNSEVLEVMGPSFNARYVDRSGSHSSDTVDYAVVISGRLWLETGDGDEVVLGPGDCVVQTGVRHVWRNRSDEPCRVAFIIVGAERGSDPEAERDGVVARS